MQGRVLIVDDDPLVSGSLKEIIGEFNHCVAETAADPFEALEKVHTNSFDVVLSDIMMPGMTGIDFLRRVKELDPELPVVMITGYPTLDLAIAAMKEGAADFIKKPFQIETIQNVIERIIKEQQVNEDRKKKNDPYFQQKTIKELRTSLREKAYEISLLHAMNESFYNTQDEPDVESIYQLIVRTSCIISTSERAVFLVYDRITQLFTPVASCGIPLEICDTIPAQAAYTLLHNRDFTFDEPYTGALSKSLGIHGEEGCNTGILLPVIIQQQFYGILYVGRKEFWKTFSSDEVMLLKNLARKASLAIENKLLSQSVYTNTQNMLNTLVAVIGARDHYTLTHSMRVTEYACQIGQACGCTRDELDMLNFAAHLHDIGKIGISDIILLKPAVLTEQEFKQIRQHPIIGEYILKPLGYLPRERDIIRYHHERLDGKGYPDGLQGEEIPFLSRILTVADSFDAMTTDRPYRKALTVPEALKELQRCTSQFDQNIVAVFLDVIGQRLS